MGGIIPLMPNRNDEEVVRRAPLFTALDDASAATLRRLYSREYIAAEGGVATATTVAAA
jgi:hypothetical protein